MEMVKFTDVITVSEAAKEIGVSRQRMHQILDQYAVSTEPIHGRLSVMKRSDFEKICRDREKNQGD